MTADPAPRLRVDADLSLDLQLDPQPHTAGVAARLTGSGDRLVLESQDPVATWDAVTGAALPTGVAGADGPRAVGRLGDALSDAGLRLDVRGPRGSIARLGDGVDSPLGRLATGSRRVAPGTPSALGPLLVARLRQERAARAAAAGVVALVLVLAARRRRGR